VYTYIFLAKTSSNLTQNLPATKLFGYLCSLNNHVW